MFEKHVYIQRRQALREKCKKGILILPGNTESPINYSANAYHFRQDSNFLYFFGIDIPELTGIIDFDENKDIIYGNDASIDEIIWMGERPSLAELAAKTGVQIVKSSSLIKSDIQGAIKKGKDIFILPIYRPQQLIYLSDILDIKFSDVKKYVSDDLIKAIVSLREIKEDIEINQIEHAVDTAYKMHTTMMKMAVPGTWEREIAGTIEGIALKNGGTVSFPVILSMDGQTLHNHYHGNILSPGRMLLTDAGCESPMHYASDITRTVPVGGKFSQRQKEIYEIVLEANMKCIEEIKPGIFYKDIHLIAARVIAKGLNNIGLLKGDLEEAVMKGAHALFFPHGIGHMLGLDVHDMESLGEDHVGYDESINRSTQFGTAFLRLAKRLKQGFTITVEPGIYFIPALIDIWRNENKFREYINYSKLESYKNFGGIRIEDDILVTQSSCRVLGKPIPKKITEIEEFMVVN